jgi:hypothetical protein
MLGVIWVVLMMFWLFAGCYFGWDPAKPARLSSTLFAWACVLILGLIVFKVFAVGPVGL